MVNVEGYWKVQLTCIGLLAALIALVLKIG
jgi:hypothetical protein